ncbi:IS66 family insertion sequence element accessory protein TnpB [Rhizobium lentis]|uniref:IS66 family insertion sequence element accessory protein TnpB n=1 Tax=Rhizobium lentis TaxID=1138194 RepID=UPI0035C8888A
MVLKRLTEDRFRWPRRETAVAPLSTEQLHWILVGFDADAMVRHPVQIPDRQLTLSRLGWTWRNGSDSNCDESNPANQCSQS